MDDRIEMEQKRSSSNNKCNQTADSKENMVEVLIHNQVRRIKQLDREEIRHLSVEQPEMRRVLLEITGRQKRSRSPLGLPQRPIS
ncbi:hypothetical protein Ancab_021212 [Ancistrocladus abbreviatus]